MDAAWFKQTLRKAGKTSADLAAAIGRDRAVMSRIMNGHQKMTLDQAQVIAGELGVDAADILVRAGLAGQPVARAFSPGFGESDVAPLQLAEGAPRRPQAIADILGARPGVDVWTVKGVAMALGGLLAGDFILVDTHQAERARAGDVVIAQVYGRTDAKTVLRRYEPPVLVAASPDPADNRVLVVDGDNVVIRGKVVASWRVA